MIMEGIGIKQNIRIKQRNRVCVLGMLCIMIAVLFGCGAAKEKTEKVRDLEFTVVGEDRQPEELRTILEEKKENPFKMTYTDQDYLYICVGYGEQSSGGYSITVNKLYLTENAVYIDTNLIGPSPGESSKTGKQEGSSYPYIVVKTEYLDKTVVFD